MRYGRHGIAEKAAVRGLLARKQHAAASARRRAAERMERRAMMYLREVNEACAAWLRRRGLIVEGGATCALKRERVEAAIEREARWTEN